MRSQTGTLLIALGLFLTVQTARPQAQTASNPDDGVTALTSSQVLQRLVARTAPNPPPGATAPSFVVDPGWPKPLPNNWKLGQIGGLFVDHRDHIWVYHRPRSLNSNEAGALGPVAEDETGTPVSALGHPRPWGQYSGCCTPAPSVLEFDTQGNLLQAWGGPADAGFLETRCRVEDGCVWPAREHGITVDHNDFVYISGNGQNFTGQFPWAATFGDDSHILKFTRDGTFVLQIGHAGATGPDSDDIDSGPNGTPQVYLPADMSVDPQSNTLFIADGYGNRRVLMVDAETGQYLGHFGAYGQNPVDSEGDITENVGYDFGPWMEDFSNGNMKPAFFRSPVHCAKLARDGRLYVCDRGNNRVQVFDAASVGQPCDNPSGQIGRCGFLGEVHVAAQTAAGTVGSVALSSDENESCLYAADLSNGTIFVLNRDNLHELGRVGRGGRQVGEFHWVHAVSTDSQGNLYTGEVDTAMRVQKFLRYGATGCAGNGRSPVGDYR
jgi:DNA-binding beta-propeller fold protein YncE